MVGVITLAPFAYLHAFNVHTIYHGSICVRADIQHNVLPSFVLIDQVKIEESHGLKRVRQLSSFSRHHVYLRLKFHKHLQTRE